MSGRAVVSIYKNSGKLIISPSQPYGDGTFVAGQTFQDADVLASDEELGQLALQALQQSAEMPAVPDASPTQRESEWQTAITKVAAVSNYAVFQRNALLVKLYRYEDGDVEVAPSVHDGDEFMMKLKEMDTLSSPTAESLGVAIRSALERSE